MTTRFTLFDCLAHDLLDATDRFVSEQEVGGLVGAKAYLTSQLPVEKMNPGVESRTVVVVTDPDRVVYHFTAHVVPPVEAHWEIR